MSGQIVVLITVVATVCAPTVLTDDGSGGSASGDDGNADTPVGRHPEFGRRR